MIFGALTHLVIQTVRFGYKGATWFIVHIIVYGWAISYTLTGTCSNQLTLVLRSTPRLGLSLGVLSMLVTQLGSTTLTCLRNLFCLMALFSDVSIMLSQLVIVSLRTLFMMAKPCSRFGTLTR